LAWRRRPSPIRAALQKNLDANFKAIDTNGDGVLSQAELAAAELKGQQARVTQIRSNMETEFNKLDTDHNGQLSKAEFMAAAPQMPTTAPTGADVIAQLDTNHDGKVSAAEFSAPQLARFDKIDTNRDGTISAAERAALAKPATKKR
jgi:capsule polysaccharide export protein KpsE/RkpR